MEDGKWVLKELPAWAGEGVPVSAGKGWGLEELRSRIEVALAG
jgi:hypothetical protein